VDWLSLVPPLITFAAVVLSRRVVLSLALGVAAGALAKAGWSVSGLLLMGSYLAGAASQGENTYVLVFLVLFGGLAQLINVAGGIRGFTDFAGRWAKSERRILLLAWAMLPITFFDNVFRILSVGSILEPLMDKVKGVKERLAFVLAVTSGQAIVLVPLGTAYAGYMVSLVRGNSGPAALDSGVSAYGIFLRSLMWNFFSPTMLVLSLGVSIWGIRYGKIRLAVGVREQEFTKVHREKEAYLARLPPEYPSRTANLILPLAVFLASTLFFLWNTGRARAPSFLGALGAADYSASIMTGALVTLGVTVAFFWAQKISLAEIEAHLIEGAQGVLSLLAILVLSWALSQIVRDLGFTGLITSVLARAIPPWAVPVTLFLAGSGISYVIGSSWATWALLLPLGAVLAEATALNPAVVFGAVWAGGSVGDSTSPVADLPILVSSVAKIRVADYAGSALPFTLAGIAVSAILYVVAGLRLV